MRLNNTASMYKNQCIILAKGKQEGLGHIARRLNQKYQV